MPENKITEKNFFWVMHSGLGYQFGPPFGIDLLSYGFDLDKYLEKRFSREEDSAKKIKLINERIDLVGRDKIVVIRDNPFTLDELIQKYDGATREELYKNKEKKAINAITGSLEEINPEALKIILPKDRYGDENSVTLVDIAAGYVKRKYDKARLKTVLENEIPEDEKEVLRTIAAKIEKGDLSFLPSGDEKEKFIRMFNQFENEYVPMFRGIVKKQLEILGGKHFIEGYVTNEFDYLKFLNDNILKRHLKLYGKNVDINTKEIKDFFNEKINKSINSYKIKLIGLSHWHNPNINKETSLYAGKGRAKLKHRIIDKEEIYLIRFVKQANEEFSPRKKKPLILRKIMFGDTLGCTYIFGPDADINSLIKPIYEQNGYITLSEKDLAKEKGLKGIQIQTKVLIPGIGVVFEIQINNIEGAVDKGFGKFTHPLYEEKRKRQLIGNNLDAYATLHHALTGFFDDPHDKIQFSFRSIKDAEEYTIEKFYEELKLNEVLISRIKNYKDKKSAKRVLQGAKIKIEGHKRKLDNLISYYSTEIDRRLIDGDLDKGYEVSSSELTNKLDFLLKFKKITGGSIGDGLIKKNDYLDDLFLLNKRIESEKNDPKAISKLQSYIKRIEYLIDNSEDEALNKLLYQVKFKACTKTMETYIISNMFPQKKSTINTCKKWANEYGKKYNNLTENQQKNFKKWCEEIEDLKINNLIS